MSMAAPTTPMLVSGDAEEVQDLTGSDKSSSTEREVPVGVSLPDRERKNKDKERKRNAREASKQKAFTPVLIGVSVSESSPASSVDTNTVTFFSNQRTSGWSFGYTELDYRRRRQNASGGILRAHAAIVRNPGTSFEST
jgi:phosphoribosyl-AMP cyclohydrolase